jgi:hypothetical protein
MTVRLLTRRHGDAALTPVAFQSGQEPRLINAYGARRAWNDGLPETEHQNISVKSPSLCHQASGKLAD